MKFRAVKKGILYILQNHTNSMQMLLMQANWK
jgi:hypothetical protein